MMLIHCPCCGPRNQEEFLCGGQAHINRPENPELLSDRDWAHYQFVRENPKGLHAERWMHLYGCGQWFNVLRDTRTHEIQAVYGITEDAPGVNP
ncbi:MAG: sarcosine oxidase subunit delta [Xanthomonadales bacterium]|jgi:heterotetrameric sarcosine oxidase delta subunit|nr:sarcosine oxidase subunit delta [Xanthomonadales bacterium]